MSLATAITGLLIAAAFIVMILFVLFGQITVRKLRKKPATKDELGLEFASGWDIINVASALAMPIWLNKKLKNTPLSGLYANAEILHKHTNYLDLFLARIFYALFVMTGVSAIVFAILSSIGIFDK